LAIWNDIIDAKLNAILWKMMAEIPFIFNEMCSDRYEPLLTNIVPSISELILKLNILEQAEQKI